MHRVVLVDDDPLSLETLRDTLSLNFNNYEVVDTCSGVKDALSKLPGINADLVFLDMELMDGKGFDILEALGEIRFEVIVITMYDSYMLEAIKHSAIDYLMKPVKKELLQPALERYEKRLLKLGRNLSNNPSANPNHNRLVIPNQNGLVLLDIDQILRLESDGAYTKIFSLDNKQYFASKNLGHYEQLLASHNFFRVHHSHIVNLEQLKHFSGSANNIIQLSDDTQIEVSRRKKSEFLKMIARMHKA